MRITFSTEPLYQRGDVKSILVKMLDAHYYIGSIENRICHGDNKGEHYPGHCEQCPITDAEIFLEEYYPKKYRKKTSYLAPGPSKSALLIQDFKFARKMMDNLGAVLQKAIKEDKQRKNKKW